MEPKKMKVWKMRFLFKSVIFSGSMLGLLGCNQQQYDAVEPGIPGFCYRNLEYRSAPPKGGVYSLSIFGASTRQYEVTGVLF